MTKHYGSKNKGFAKANANRTKAAIRTRIRNGETPYTSKPLAAMMDRLYGTTYTKETK